MQPSQATAGLTADRNEPQGHPSLGNPGYSGQAHSGKAAGTACAPSAQEAQDLNTQGRVNHPRPRRGVAMRATQRTSTIRADLAAAGLMPAGEHTVPGPGGHELPANPEVRRVSDPAEADFLNAGGWRVVSIKGGDEEGGVTSHRGAVHPDEHVDTEALRCLVERELGFSYEQVRSAYGRGRPSAERRELRGRIDARLLALSHEGANLALLGRLLGFHVEPDSHCAVIDSALARARMEEQ